MIVLNLFRNDRLGLSPSSSSSVLVTRDDCVLLGENLGTDSQFLLSPRFSAGTTGARIAHVLESGGTRRRDPDVRCASGIQEFLQGVLEASVDLTTS